MGKHELSLSQVTLLVCMCVLTVRACVLICAVYVYWTVCLLGLGRVLDVWPGIALGLTS